MSLKRSRRDGDFNQTVRRDISTLARNSLGIIGAFAMFLGGCVMSPTRGDSPAYSTQSASASGVSKPTGFDPATAVDDVVKAHNRLRAEAKLPRLTVSRKLQAAAEMHAKDMANRKKMTHKGEGGKSVVDRITAEGYRYRRAGENIAVGRLSVDRLMKGWMDSPPHKRNILGSFSQIGVAYATAEDGKRYWCVTFGLPARR